MNRREAIKRTSILMGGIISAPVIMGLLKGCKAKPGIAWKPLFFTEEQATAISIISEFIIPETDTPGAMTTGVPAFIEEMVHQVYSPEDRDKFMNGLADFIQHAKSRYNNSFQELDAEEQAELINQLHSEAVTEDLKDEKPEAYERPFILKMKELTMIGFFTSQPGATKVLQHEAVPGHYFGCRPLHEVGGKTWS